MRKYYDKELPVTVHVTYGERYAGRTYREFKRLEERIKRLEEENKHIFANVNDDELLISNAMNYAEKNELQQRIDKAIEYIKENEKEYGSLLDNEKIILKILKGEEQ